MNTAFPLSLFRTQLSRDFETDAVSIYVTTSMFDAARKEDFAVSQCRSKKLQERILLNLRFSGAFVQLQKTTISFVRPSAWNKSAPTGQILIKPDIWDFLANLPRKFKFNWNMIRIMGPLREDVFTVLTVSYSIVLRVINILEKSYSENQNTYFMFNNVSFENHVALWDNVEKYGRARGATNDVTTWRIWAACWISKATCTRLRSRAHARTHICSTYCHSTATVVTWKRLSVTRVVLLYDTCHYKHCVLD
jgi:hypothetical protein